MATFQLINVQPIMSPEDAPRPQMHRHSSIGGSPRLAPAPMSLEDIKTELGVLYVPSYLPAGFLLAQAHTSGSTTQLSYSSRVSESLKEVISVVHFSNSAHPKLRSGFFHEVSVGSKPRVLHQRQVVR